MDEYAYYEGLDQHGLYPIRIPYRGVPYTCDIFIVHGLNGGTHRSFNHPTTNNVWFRDFLPDHVFDEVNRTNGRIWAYGYNAAYAFQNAGNTGPYDLAIELLHSVLHARKKGRKIIFVCHSLGGIIVKNALVQATVDKTYSDITQSTIGVIFVGTPHRGTSLANMSDVAQRVGEAVFPGYRPNRLLIQNLKKNCDSLYQSANNFGNISKDLKIFSFYETVGTIIVQKESAVMNLHNEVPLPLNASHRDMCKFKDRTDPEYIKIKRSVQELMALTSPVGQRAPNQNPTLHSVPLPYPDSGQNSMPQDGPRYQPNSSVPRTAPAPPFTHWGQHYQPISTHPSRGFNTPQDMPDVLTPGSTSSPSSQSSRGTTPFDIPDFNRPQRPPPIPRKHVPSEADRLREEEELQRAIELSKQEQARKEQAARDEARREEVRREQIRQEDARREAMRQEQLKEDQARLEQIRTEQKKLEDLREEQAKLEKLRQERARSNSTLSPESSSAAHSTRNRAASQPPPPKQEEHRPGPSVTTRPVSSAPAVPMKAPEPEPEEQESKWMCDTCMCTFGYSIPRITCLECEDYDLCSRCYQLDRVSKSHQTTHDIRRVKATYNLTVTDLIAADEQVNPEDSFGAKNWSIGEGDVRWLSLRETNHHARFIATGLPQGHHYIELELLTKLSPKLSQASRQQLASTPLCKVTVHVGWPKDRKTFAHERFVEDASLAEKIFSQSIKKAVEISPDTSTLLKIPLPTGIFHMGDDNQNNKQLGFLLQWEDVLSFTNSDDAIVQIALVNVILADLVDWKTTPAPAAASKSDEKDASSAGTAFGVLFGAMVEQVLEQQQEEERQQRILAARREAARQAQEQEEIQALAAQLILLGILNG